MREYRFAVGEGERGAAVGNFLKRRGFSTRTIVGLKRDPLGIRVRRAGEAEPRHARTVDTLSPGDEVVLLLAEPEREVLPSAWAVPILYEDEDLLVYDKPPGMPCHTSCGHAQDTLENVYAAHCLRAGAPGRLRALNRLDRDTSGCVLVAKNQFIASRLAGRFEKTYRAIVVGEVRSDGRIEARIYRPDPVDMRRCVDERGQVAITEYGVLRAREGLSYLQFRLMTGRTHQIRVHMAHIGHPVLGDAFYGAPSGAMARQALHCSAMAFTHPLTGEPLRIRAPVPEDMRAVLCGRMGIRVE